ncbi:hypothetical protein U1Q18_040745 [Sarracenia purpurea var. burkii]
MIPVVPMSNLGSEIPVLKKANSEAVANIAPPIVDKNEGNNDLVEGVSESVEEGISEAPIVEDNNVSAVDLVTPISDLDKISSGEIGPPTQRSKMDQRAPLEDNKTKWNGPKKSPKHLLIQKISCKATGPIDSRRGLHFLEELLKIGNNGQGNNLTKNKRRHILSPM